MVWMFTNESKTFRIGDSHNIINLRIFTTEYTEFHGGKGDFRIKTPWYSVTSVVIFFLGL